MRIEVTTQIIIVEEKLPEESFMYIDETKTWKWHIKHS